MIIEELLEEIEINLKVKRKLQSDLLNWCRDKSNPLEKRFEIWYKHAEKVEYRPPFLQEVEIPNVIVKYFKPTQLPINIDYNFLYQDVSEKDEEVVKEWPIQHNFESYTAQW